VTVKTVKDSAKITALATSLSFDVNSRLFVGKAAGGVTVTPDDMLPLAKVFVRVEAHTARMASSTEMIAARMAALENPKPPFRADAEGLSLQADILLDEISRALGAPGANGATQ
jgi:hypothetical protein